MLMLFVLGFMLVFSMLFLRSSSLRSLSLPLLLSLLLLSVVPVEAQNSSKIKKMQAERTAMKKQIGQMENLLSKAKKDVASQLRNLSLLDAQIAERQLYIAKIQAESDSLTALMGEMRKQLVQLEKELNARKNNYRSAMNYVSRSRRQQSRWVFVLMAEDFRQMYRRMRYASQYSQYQRAQGEIIKEKEAQVVRRRQELQSAKNEKDQLMAEVKKQERELLSKKQQRVQVVDELNKKQQQIQKQLRNERKKFDKINKTIDRLIQEEIAAAERRRKEEERKRKAAEAQRKRSNSKQSAGKGKSAAPSAGKTAAPNFRPADDSERKLSSNFAANQGRLPVPITGTYAITGRFGKYNVEGLKGVTLDNKGVNYTGRKGAQARCVFDGEVCSVVNIGGSYVVIVRHGTYFSVYSNLARVSVRHGQKVATRQTLGPVLDDKNGNCTLHFQLRKNTQKLNPAQWIGR